MTAAKRATLDDALQKKAFDTLALVFEKYEPQEPGQNEAHPTLAMEVLPSGELLSPGQLILEDEEERAIGVPKKVLVAAFLYAKHLFVSTEPSEYESKEIASATKIILLYDPEYLTAANARKQYLLNLLSMKAAYGPMHSMLLAHAIQRELWYLSSILTSPLHRQSKSPTLWFQRAWIYRTFHGECEALMGTREWVLGELNVVLKAGERHQHNYYAFLYARRVIAAALKALADQERYSYSEAKALQREVLERQLAWCKSHPSDTSGWSFLAFWIRAFLKASQRRETLYLVLEFARTLDLKGEALWSFLKSFVVRHHGDASRNDEDQDLSLRILMLMSKMCPKLLGSSADKQARLVENDWHNSIKIAMQ